MVKRLGLVVVLLVNLVAASLALGTPRPAAAATTHTVCAIGCDFTTIQAAITAAASGDTITVAAGTYQEQIVINKSLTITGAGADTTTILIPAVPVCTGPGTSAVIVEVNNAANVTMSGFTIAGPPTTLACTPNIFGVYVVGGANLNLSASTVRDIRPAPAYSGALGGYAIRLGSLDLAQVGTGTLTNLTIKDYLRGGVYVDGPGSNVALSSSTVTGLGPITLNAQNGVAVLGGATATITGNTISGHLCDVVVDVSNPVCGPEQAGSPDQVYSFGVLVISAGAVTVTNNVLSNNDGGFGGFSLTVPANVTITGNAITANRYRGLALWDGSYVVANNDITGASLVGVQVVEDDLGGDTEVTLTNNRIANAARGVQLLDTTPNAYTAKASGSANSLADNGIGVDNGTIPPVNFAGNWWGSPRGPQTAANPGGDGTPTVGNVLFTPFLTDGTDFSDARGFQPGALSAGLSASTLTFGNQAVGTTSAAQPVTLTNTGSVPLNIGLITVSGDFAQTNNCPASLAAAANCTINVTFTPVVGGARNGTLTIFDNAANSPQNVALSGTGVGAATTFTVTATVVGDGTINQPGATIYAVGTEATYTATAGTGQIFTGWTLDGTYVGYASPLKFTVSGNRTLVATFVARPTFSDVPTSDPDYQAITILAALGVINPAGVNGSGKFEPEREVVRAEMASFVARVFGWQKEFHANSFPDKCDQNGQNCIDDELWNNVAALADYGVVGGYTDTTTCQSAGTISPCYLPRDPVLRVQVLSIIARAFIKTPDLRPSGFWDRLAADPSQYTNVPDTGTQRSDLTTYRANAGAVPGQTSDTTFPNPGGNGSRRFVIQALYAAFSAQFGTDHIP